MGRHARDFSVGFGHMYLNPQTHVRFEFSSLDESPGCTSGRSV